jgi:hypothetical protein
MLAANDGTTHASALSPCSQGFSIAAEEHKTPIFCRGLTGQARVHTYFKCALTPNHPTRDSRKTTKT